MTTGPKLRTSRVVLGFMLAPLAPVPVAACCHRDLAAVVTFVMVVFGYPASWLFGVPALAWLLRRGAFLWWQWTASAAGVGAAIASVLYLPLIFGGVDYSNSMELASSLPVFALFGATLGGISGLAFWFIAVRSTPPRVAAASAR